VAAQDVLEFKAYPEEQAMPSDEVSFRLSISDPKSIDMADLQRSLEGRGFRVTPDGRRGFMLTATQELAERFFNTSIKQEGSSLSFATDSSNNTILNGIDFRIYFPTRPDYFP
jgi:hypothetical protein